MKGLTVTFLFYSIITLALQNPIPQNSLNIVVDPVEKALQSMGINKASCCVDWKYAFGRLAERYEQKDRTIRQLTVLNFIRTHMESFSLQTDPRYDTHKRFNSTMVTMNRDDIPSHDIPSNIQALEADFKYAYGKWYRIIKNSNDPRIKALLDALKKEPLCEETPLTEQDIAKTLAVIWCTVGNGIHSLLGAAKGQIVWKNADEVADAFAAFQDDGFYVDFVRIFLKVTKFGDRLAVKKSSTNQ